MFISLMTFSLLILNVIFFFYLIFSFSIAIALVASAGLKLSRARKDSLRPIFNTPAVLRQDPTGSDILGGEDLAALSEKTTKEQAALRRVFRNPFSQRGRFKFGRANFRNRLSRGRYYK